MVRGLGPADMDLRSLVIDGTLHTAVQVSKSVFAFCVPDSVTCGDEVTESAYEKRSGKAASLGRFVQL